MAFILNYVPYLGALAGILILAVVGLLSFASLSQALAMPAFYLACAILEGNFITPSILGRLMTLHPLAVFLALLFWGWIWGLAGVFLAVPLLAVCKILCDHTPSLRPLGALLGGRPAEAPGLRGKPNAC
jgi:predicted PurR-regulated permease PerM